MADARVVPGTIHLVDLEGILSVKHASGAQKDVVLIPPPSDDANDPLNWSPARKLTLSASISVYTFAIGIASAATYSVFDTIERDTGLTLDELNRGTGYMFLLFGWGCLFWQPLAVQYGKRPVYLVSVLATMAIMIWIPFINTNSQYIASKLLQGFFGAPVESLCALSITDTYFTHERGTYIAIYGFFLGASSFLAPVFAGFINDGQGWKWVLFWCAILCGVGFVFLFFSMEETNYHRIRPKVSVNSTTKNEVGNSSQSGELNPCENDSPRAQLETSVEFWENSRPKSWQEPRSFYEKLRIFDKEELRYPNRLKGMVFRALIFLTFPVIFYAGFSYGSNIVWFNVLNGTTSLILSRKPYDFASSTVGLAYLAPFTGMTIGTFYTGKVGNWVILKLARMNQGIMRSEYRLWLFVPSIFLVPGGLMLWGVGAAHNVPWFGLVFAMSLIGFTNSVGLQLSVSYCVDSYQELSGEALVTMILVRNSMSFAVGYGITPWVTHLGLQNAFIVAGIAGLAQVLTVFIFIQYGERFRRASVDRYRYYKEKMVVAGLVH